MDALKITEQDSDRTLLCLFLVMGKTEKLKILNLRNILITRPFVVCSHMFTYVDKGTTKMVTICTSYT